jgi:uncharacterized membrane protein YqhA
MRILETWQHYLKLKKFVIHIDHQYLRHLKVKVSWIVVMLSGWNLLKHSYMLSNTSTVRKI